MGKCIDAMAEVFGLGACERTALSVLCRRSTTVAELSPLCRKSRPRLAQALSKLLAMGLVSRRKVGRARGYEFVYFASPKKRLASVAKARLIEKQKLILRALSSD